MNKVCVTKHGVRFFKEEKEEVQNQQKGRTINFENNTKKSSSLPHLISTASLAKKKEISQRLSHLSLKLSKLKNKGLKKMLTDLEDETLTKIMQKQFQDRKTYLRTIVPTLVRKTRDLTHFGNIKSRLERSRAYIDRLEQNYERKLTFSPHTESKDG